MDEKIRSFLIKYAQDQHTDKEHEEFIEWLHNASEPEIHQVLAKFPHLQEIYPLSSAPNDQLIGNLEKALDRSSTGKIKIISIKARIYRVVAVAAALLLILGGWTYLLQRNEPSKKVVAKHHSPVASEPAKSTGNKASLTLADGSTIVLDDAVDGLITVQGGIRISKTANGQLKYDASHASKNFITGFNTISTPRGGQYQLLMPDGTQVWLNATSSIKFPASFSKEERRVELIGEGYFEVAKDKARPFRVVSGNQAIEVLGTHFNVNAYPDDKDIRTTLLEGSVKVTQTSTNRSQKLTPGQQSVMDENIVVAKVNAMQFIGWKNGYFVFSHENIQSIMQKIRRWYDVDVYYEGAITKEAFTGSISRFEKVTDVLDMLQLTHSVHFRIEGRKITVVP